MNIIVLYKHKRMQQNTAVSSIFSFAPVAREEDRAALAKERAAQLSALASQGFWGLQSTNLQLAMAKLCTKKHVFPSCLLLFHGKTREHHNVDSGCSMKIAHEGLNPSGSKLLFPDFRQIGCVQSQSYNSACGSFPEDSAELLH